MHSFAPSNLHRSHLLALFKHKKFILERVFFLNGERSPLSSINAQKSDKVETYIDQRKIRSITSPLSSIDAQNLDKIKTCINQRKIRSITKASNKTYSLWLIEAFAPSCESTF
jgi:hypothetical protein